MITTIDCQQLLQQKGNWRSCKQTHYNYRRGCCRLSYIKTWRGVVQALLVKKLGDVKLGSQGVLSLDTFQTPVLCMTSSTLAIATTSSDTEYHCWFCVSAVITCHTHLPSPFWTLLNILYSDPSDDQHSYCYILLSLKDRDRLLLDIRTCWKNILKRKTKYLKY